MQILARALSVVTLLALTLISGAHAVAGETTKSHGLSLFGELKYGPDFRHFDYVNPDAPKGGRARLFSLSSFDSLNPFINKGRPASGLQLLTYDTLLKSAFDEPGSEYGLVAEAVEIPADYSFVTFTLRPEARWHDGKPITPEDVVFSFETLKEKGMPFYRFYYANVAKAEALDERRVKFTFDSTGNRELPQIVGQLPLLPKHYWVDKDLAETTLTPPLSSGPYRIARMDKGHSITYERVADYWGRDLPVNRGQDNFDEVIFETFADTDVALQGLFADVYDFRTENSSRNWATRYDIPQVKNGFIIKETITLKNAQPMQAFIFNLRRSKFADARVRLAFAHAFDFEWANKNLFYDQYTRTESYFPNSDLAAGDLPTPLELEILEPFRDQLPLEVFSEIYKAPKTDGSGNNRANLRKAKTLLEEAGWFVKGGNLTHSQTGEVMRVEFLEDDTTFERVIQGYRQNLERLGIKTAIRIADEAQYINRLRNFDFDIVISGFAQSLSPGNEQRDFWGSEAADRPESRNIAGIKNPVVDAIIDQIIFAEDRSHLVAAVRALDRVLLWNHYVVPQWHIPYERLAYWNRFGHPDTMPDFTVGFPSIWWYDADKAAATAAKKAN